MPRAGLGPVSVTCAGAVLADERGIDRLTMGLLAERLGVRAPSLYKHVDDVDDLTHRIGVLAIGELADATGEAIQGRSGSDALNAAAHAMRRFVTEHPGRYAAGSSARSTGPGDPLVPAARRLLDTLSAALRGYGLEPEEQVHALRMLRSVVHGFASLEARDDFQLETSRDESFAWMVALLDAGLRAAGSPDQHDTPDQHATPRTARNPGPPKAPTPTRAEQT